MPVWGIIKWLISCPPPRCLQKAALWCAEISSEVCVQGWVVGAALTRVQTYADYSTATMRVFSSLFVTSGFTSLENQPGWVLLGSGYDSLITGLDTQAKELRRFLSAECYKTQHRWKRKQDCGWEKPGWHDSLHLELLVSRRWINGNAAYVSQMETKPRTPPNRWHSLTLTCIKAT